MGTEALVKPLMNVQRVRSQYNPKQTGIGIVHLGLGAFVRAHLAVYIEKLLNQKHGAWGICAANIRSNRAIVDALREQGLRYTVAEYAARDDVTLREVNSIREVLFAGEGETAALLERMANLDTKIVSLTVTEKGYCFDLANQLLITDSADMQHDLKDLRQPRTAIGIITAALKHRFDFDLPPFTVLSCDNMPHNGRVTRAAVIQLAQHHSADLAAWISEQVKFPCTMVDRIVPAATPESVAQVQALLSDYADAVPIACEAFSQWVIEDAFAQERPELELAGAQLVEQAAPWEAMKLRMLNGSHSLLAYLGYLGELPLVSDCVAQPEYRALLQHYMLNEAAPTLQLPASADVPAYAHQLLQRFANDSLRHRTWQIAMDGSQKIPQRWLAGAHILLQRGELPKATALGIAAWIQYVAGTDEQGNAIDVSDPLADQLRNFAANSDVQQTVADFMALPMFQQFQLGTYSDFTAHVAAYLNDLRSYGARQTVANFS